MSFRPKSTFTALLYNNLTSNLWKSIKDSLLGSELISYAAEFLYQQEVLSDSIISSVYPSDKSGLMNLMLCGNFNNVAFSYFRPSSVTIKVDVQSPQLYEPFSLRLSKGNISYTNIDWVSSDNAITLYQGVPQVAFVNGGIQNRSRFQQVTTEFSASVYRTAGDSEYFSNVVKLDSLAYADSVYVYSTTKGDISWTTYQLYDSINAGEDACNYKLQWGTDVNLQVQFGNGLWGKTLQTNQEYYIYFLDATFNSVETDGLVLENALDNSTSRTRINYEVISFENYSVTTDVAYRNLKNALSKNSVIATKEQIEDFVKAYPLVADCAAVKSQYLSNTVEIYVRPSANASEDIDATYFSDITETLQTYGELVTAYLLYLATAEKLRVKVTVLDDITYGEKADIEARIISIVTSYFENTSLGDSVDFSNLSNEIYGEIGYRNVVRFYVASEIVQNYKLNSLPVLSTIKNIGSGESYWDGVISNGVLWGSNPASQYYLFDYMFPWVVSLGDFMLVTDKDKRSYLCNGSSLKIATENLNGYFPVQSFEFSTTTERYITTVSLGSAQGSGTDNNLGLIGIGVRTNQNFGYYSSSSDNNVFSPEIGFIDFTPVNIKRFSNMTVPIIFSDTFRMTAYKDKVYSLASTDNAVVLSAINTNTGTIDSKRLTDVQSTESFRGFYVNDTSLNILTVNNRLYSLPNFDNGLNIVDSYPFRIVENSSIVSATTMVTGVFSPISFGSSHGAFLSSTAEKNSDGRIGINVVEVAEAMPTSMTILCDNNYAVLYFICPSAYSESTTGYRVYYDSVDSDVVVEFGSSRAENFGAMRLVHYNQQGVNMSDYANGYPSTLIVTGMSDNIIATVSLNYQNEAPTYTFKTVKTPEITNEAVLQIEETYSKSGNFSFPNVYYDAVYPGGTSRTFTEHLQSLSLHEYHYLSQDSDGNHYILADVLLFAESTTESGKFSYLGNAYVERCIIRCSSSDNTFKVLVSEDNYEFNELVKKGAFDSVGVLTMFDGTLDKLLKVAYETQNAYFAIDETRYAELADDEAINVEFV